MGISSLSQVCFFPKERFLLTNNNLWIAVSLAAYKKIKDKREARGRCIRFFYHQNELHITMPISPYERAHAGLYYDYIGNQITQMRIAGSTRKWITMASTAFPSQDGASEGEGDSTGGPNPERLSFDDWPTLVIEAGYTQSYASLRRRCGGGSTSLTIKS